MLIATLVGLRVASVPGALAGTFATILPSSILTIIITQARERFHTARWRRVQQAATTPISGGLLLDFGFILAGDADHNWRLGVVTIAVIIATLRSRIHPLFFLGAGAIIGVFSYG